MRVENRFNELIARKERIEKRSLTRRQIADETGLSLSSVQSWATNDVTRFDGVHIATFCRYLKCTIDDLLILVEDEEAPEIDTPLLAIA